MGTPSHSIVRENRGPVLWYTQRIEHTLGIAN